ncbi:hypothetical protein [Streptomyces xantholiticus]|uniref:hypothetical protein n=1 Tax=Streptomyces xantholiticus TaxID=68285 RepID=UPI0019B6D391|nr:hypothetical protein [Streptomyces xantholiticus]GGW25490.1 hypothetical protein GCM10010381_06450 [Streptomyces xantholiticus]
MEAGIWWPDANSGTLRSAAKAWHTFAEAVDDIIGPVNTKAGSIILNNKGEAIDASKRTDQGVFLPGRMNSHGKTLMDFEVHPTHLSDAIRSNPNYDGGPVRLISCHSGYAAPNSGELPLAQRVANDLGVPVYAPTNKVGTSPDLGPDIRHRSATTATGASSCRRQNSERCNGDDHDQASRVLSRIRDPGRRRLRPVHPRRGSTVRAD